MVINHRIGKSPLIRLKHEEECILILRRKVPGDLTVGLVDSQAEMDALFAFFNEVASEQGWETNGEIESYAGRSIFISLLLGSTIIGGFQIIRNLGNGNMPTLRVWPELTEKFGSSYAGVGILAIHKDYRGKRLYWLLASEVWKLCNELGIPGLWAELPPLNFRAFNAFGWPFTRYGEKKEHWGELCVAACMPFSAMRAEVHKRSEDKSTGEEYRKILEYVYGG